MSSVGFRLPAAASRLGVKNEVAGGVIDGSNLTYTTAYEFIPGTLEVFIDGVKKTPPSADPDHDYEEAANHMGFTFVLNPEDPNRMNMAPCQSEQITVNYERESTVPAPC